MRASRFVVASLFAVALAGAAATKAGAGVLINIDKNAQRMSVSVDGTARYVWPVSTGRPGYDTPNGIFKANRMDADHLSQEWDMRRCLTQFSSTCEAMPFTVFLTRNTSAYPFRMVAYGFLRPMQRRCSTW